MMFSQLPDSLVSVIYSEWIEVKDLVRLDSSLTNGNVRKEHFNILASETTSIAGLYSDSYHYNYERQNIWAKSRGASLNTIFMALANVVLQNYSSNDLRKIRTIQFRDQDVDDSGVLLINSCPNLTALTFLYGGGDAEEVLPKVDPNIVKKLMIIPPIHSTGFSFLSRHCTSLTSIDIYCKAIKYRDDGESEEEEDEDDVEEDSEPENEHENEVDEDDEDDESTTDRIKHKVDKALVKLMRTNPNLKRIQYIADGECDAIDLRKLPDLKSFDLDHLEFTALGGNDYFVDTFPHATAMEISFQSGDDYPDYYNDEEPVWYECSYDKRTNTIKVKLYCYEYEDGYPDLARVTPAITTLTVDRVGHDHGGLPSEYWDIIEEHPALSVLHLNDIYDSIEEFEMDQELKEKLVEQKRTLSIFVDGTLAFCIENGVEKGEDK